MLPHDHAEIDAPRGADPTSLHVEVGELELVLTALESGDLAARIDAIADGLDRLHAQPIVCAGLRHGVRVEVALLWTDTEGRSIHGSVARAPVTRGTHLQGYRAGLRDAWLGHASAVAPSHFSDFIERGLVAIVDVELAAPEFGGPGRQWLVSPSAKHATRAVVCEGLRDALEHEPALCERLMPTPRD